MLPILPASIVIDQDKKTMSINGELFPYFIAKDGPVVNPFDPAFDGCPTVTLTLLATHVEVVGGVSVDAPVISKVSESDPYGTPMPIAEFDAKWAAAAAPANQAWFV